MTCSLAVAWDDALTQYDFGPGHPMAPVRVALTMALASELDVLSAPSVTMLTPRPATDAELELVHDGEYVEAVRTAGRELRPDLRFGLGTPDDPVFPGMHEASALVTGATLAAARAVWDGSSWSAPDGKDRHLIGRDPGRVPARGATPGPPVLHGVSVSGGLHHAKHGAASGFCVYNDPAIAIKWLLSAGAERIAYVDTDVHHGDGVQDAFYDDPRVLTISLHEHPATLFPGTGLPGDIGAGAAQGYAVNVALPAGTGDREWLRAFDAVVPPLLRAFRPTLLVTQHGCDSHALDPLAHLELSVDAQRAAAVMLHDLAHELCDGRWLATGGGGYALVQVVPRTWTHLLAVAAGAPVDPSTAIPAKWRDTARRLTGETAPSVMTDGPLARYAAFSSGYDPADPVDRTIMRTRSAVFAHHGLVAHL